ncbi:unnamed protein product [Urochloa decumbens]|uniref:Uncharacterized protein n=1 Tax=Urochloa decumbens TaxID=240449 RepID=A0ABC9B9G6_9POAL
MPFRGLAEHVPEHGRLWFGLSTKGDGCRFTAANLMPASPESEEETTMGSPPPVVHGCWKEFVQPPPEWRLVRSQAVYLGSSKFCIVRFFEVGELCVCPKTGRKYMVEGMEDQAVITGVEVESCGGGGGEELRVVRHKSQRYKLNVLSYYWVL